MTWNGAIITGPILIYHDEIVMDTGPSYLIGDPNRQGALICSCEMGIGAAWYFSNGSMLNNIVDSNIGVFQQIKTPSLSRVSHNSMQTDATFNGLLHCRCNSSAEEQITVRIYQRGGGEILRH